MRKLHAVAGLLLLWLPVGVAGAADMRLGVSSSAEYDSNVYRSEYDPQDDVVFRVTPRLSIYEDEGKAGWDLSYALPYEFGVMEKKVRDLNHRVDGRFDWQVNDRTKLFFNDNFRYGQALDNLSDQNVSNAPTVSEFRSDMLRNSTTLGVRYAFSPRLSGTASANFRIFDTQLANRSDNRTYGGVTSLQYTLSPRHRLGGGVAASYQDFDESTNGAIPASQTLFVNMFGSWSWFIDETTAFEIAAGPTFIDQHQDQPPTALPDSPDFPYVNSSGQVYAYLVNTCRQVNGMRVIGPGSNCAITPVDMADANVIADPNNVGNLSYLPGTGPGSDSNSSWTVFAEVNLSKRWTPTLVSTASYSRRDSTASGLSGSTVLDFVSLLTSWDITELWKLQVRADWTQRKSTSPATQTFVEIVPTEAVDLPSNSLVYAKTTGNLVSAVTNQSVDTVRWGASARLARRITANLTASLRYTYNRQSSQRTTAGRQSDFENHIVGIGVQYFLDPWELW